MVLELKNIIKTYNVTGKEFLDLNNVSLDFRKNEFVSIFGPSDSGKTTLLNIIGGFDRYTSGNLLKEIAKDRLVIMVTDNPELAQEYSTRIISLRDGTIQDDTDPYIIDENENFGKKLSGRTSMSFFTALGLNFNNLLTKKPRAILPSIFKPWDVEGIYFSTPLILTIIVGLIISGLAIYSGLKKHYKWFIILTLINTILIIPAIIYFVFSQ